MEGRIRRITALFLVDDYLPLSTKNHAKMMHELAIKFHSFNHKVVILTPGHFSKKILCDSIDGVIVWRFGHSPSVERAGFLGHCLRFACCLH